MAQTKEAYARWYANNGDAAMETAARPLLDGATPPPSETPPAPAKIGRPNTYSEEMADEICELVARGVSLRRIGRDPRFPSGLTIWRWLEEHKTFKEKYFSAQEFHLRRTDGRDYRNRRCEHARHTRAHEPPNRHAQMVFGHVEEVA